MTTNQPHTHRFDDDAICTRCGATYAEVQEQRAAAAAIPAGRVAEMDAVAAVNEKRIQAGHRRARYERTGR